MVVELGLFSEEPIVSFLRKWKHHPKKLFFLDLLKFVLRSNVVKLDDLVFTQLCGVAMGMRLAPALATAYNRGTTRRLHTNKTKTAFVVGEHLITHAFSTKSQCPRQIV